MARRRHYERVAVQEARRAGLRDPEAFVRQMTQEAHGQDVTSPAGAQGPAQIMPATAASWGLSPAQVHRLRSSYRAAAEHMAQYERQYGSTRNALIAYNAGPGRVGQPLPAETQNYLRIILPNGERAGRAPAPRRPRSVPGTRSQITVTPTTVKNFTTHQFDQAGYDQAVRRQKVATLLQHSGRGNSILFRSGLLSTLPIDPSGFQSTSTVQQTIPGQTTIRHGSSDVEAAIAAARKRLGLHENNGTNRSPSVDQLEKQFGMAGQPWCGIFLGTALREAGVKVDSRVASVAEIESMARNHTGGFEGGWHPGRRARRGDAVIPVAGQHVAFVTRVDPDGTIHTIGGNQADGRVTRGAYRADQVHGIARPGYKRR